MKYQVAIIGGGPAGYTAAEAAGKAGLSVVLFEKQSLGGVCLNEGCIPTKTLLYSAKTYDGARHAAKYAVSVPEVSFDLPKIIARKQKTGPNGAETTTPTISPFTNKSSMVTCSIQFMLQRCYFFTKVPIFTLKILSYPVSFI